MVLVDIFDALEELRVQADVVGMAGEDRTHLLCQGLHFVVALSTQQVEEHRAGPVQQVIVMLASLDLILRNDGILECRLLGVIDNLVDLLVLTAYTFHHRFLEIGKLYLVERHGIMRSAVRLKEGVDMLVILFYLIVHNNLRYTVILPVKMPIFFRHLYFLQNYNKKSTLRRGRADF